MKQDRLRRNVIVATMVLNFLASEGVPMSDARYVLELADNFAGENVKAFEASCADRKTLHKMREIPMDKIYIPVAEEIQIKRGER